MAPSSGDPPLAWNAQKKQTLGVSFGIYISTRQRAGGLRWWMPTIVRIAERSQVPQANSTTLAKLVVVNTAERRERERERVTRRKTERDGERFFRCAFELCYTTILTETRERPEWRRPVFRLYGTRSLLPPLVKVAEEAEAEMQKSESLQKTGCA